MNFFDNLKGTFDSVSKDVANKVNITTAIAKLNAKIKENDQMSDQVKMQLGTAVYEAWNQSEESPFADFLMRLKKLDEEKQNYQDEIVKIQEEAARLQAEKEQRQADAARMRAEEERRQAEQREAAINNNEAVNVCPSCGTSNDMDARFCVHCGQPLPEKEEEASETVEPIADEEQAQKVCPSCGNVIQEGELFCINCGTKIEN